ncbi:Co-chaperone Hsc20 [Schizopora paradoxa]|uniref:Co-chaperone Hsc20 n=1 Tax=Schizopora paradoxa TaxID=27342 RepID=A0A0H2SC31_9AGAM|nr:Co-chaperone Hsc20 [Schizopora paradoxa]
MRKYGNANIQARFISSASRQCPSCSTTLPTRLPTCPNCFHIEPLQSSVSYFELFDLPSDANAFKIDTRDLRSRFLRAQRLCHPDVWSGKGKEVQSLAEAQSSTLNAAYRTLVSPVQRAQYILAQHGLPSLETEKLEDPELIMEIMDVRESLDDSTSVAEVEAVRGRNEERMEETTARLEAMLAGENWETARNLTTELKYLEGIETAAKERSEKLSS